MKKANELPLLQKIECLHEMDKMLSHLGVASKYTWWNANGFGLQKSKEETIANWKRIASDDELFNNALLCYMMCTLEPYTLGQLPIQPIV